MTDLSEPDPWKPSPFDDFEDLVDKDSEDSEYLKTGTLSPGQIASINSFACESRMNVDALIAVLHALGYRTLKEIPQTRFSELWGAVLANLPRVKRWRWPKQPPLPKKPPARKYFACVHAWEGNEFPHYHLGNDGAGKECFWLLCELCYGFKSEAARDGLPCVEIPEAEAIERRWIPQSRSMQYLYWLDTDTRGGLALIFWGDSARNVLLDCGLLPCEIDYIHKFCELHDYMYTAGEIRRGQHVISEEMETEVARILEKRSAFLRARREGQP